MSEQPFSKRMYVECSQSILEVLAENSSLSRIKLKDALQKGAVIVKRKGKRHTRIRKAKYQLRKGDEVLFSYSAKILSTASSPPLLLTDKHAYSVWYKPPGMLSQGTNFGDHCSIIRHAELHFSGRRQIKLPHRLDRDASGLVILTHSKETAGIFSSLFHRQQILKKYYAAVSGKITEIGTKLSFDTMIEGKKALTEAVVTSSNDRYSELEIRLHTGRKHQIRIHLSQAGFPIVGDRLYGGDKRKNANLQLIAHELSFFCPVDNNRSTYRLPEDLFSSLKIF